MGRKPGTSKPPQARGCDRGKRTPGASSAQNGVTSAGGEEPAIRGPWPSTWRMADEFAFLRALGTWRPRHSVTDRAQVLRGYLAGLKLRKRWVGLECEALECEARLLLEGLDGGRSVRMSA